MQNNFTTIDNLNKQHQAINAYMQTISKIAEDIKGMETIDAANLTPEQLKYFSNNNKRV